MILVKNIKIKVIDSIFKIMAFSTYATKFRKKYIEIEFHSEMLMKNMKKI